MRTERSEATKGRSFFGDLSSQEIPDRPTVDSALRTVRPLEGNSYPFFAGGAVAVWRPVPRPQPALLLVALLLAENGVSRFFGNHHGRGIGVTANECRHDGSIYHAQAFQAGTRSSASTTAMSSLPILQVPTG